MNSFRGFVEVEIKGLGKKAFRFGTNSTALFCELRKIELHEFSGLFLKDTDYKKLAKGDLSPLKQIHLTLYRDLLWSGHVAWCRSNGEVEPNNYEVGDWIDEMGQDSFNKIISTLMNARSFETAPEVAKKKMKRATVKS